MVNFIKFILAPNEITPSKISHLILHDFFFLLSFLWVLVIAEGITPCNIYYNLHWNDSIILHKKWNPYNSKCYKTTNLFLMFTQRSMCVQLCTYVCVNFHPFYKNAIHTGIGPPSTPGWPLILINHICNGSTAKYTCILMY